ncbi:uncharacterized protein LOC113320581 [Papaver somniferum]|uniref:uncharacterized protein LOC113320581 n=1 Tax=Papaver somniferum TaxID=3469 RepID=UPI000E700309|nr:uncharacterized protein LOC113320581 [Papaver somniferum]
MGSICKSNCVVDDVSKVHPRRKASYADLHTWPESDKEFLKSVSLSQDQEQGGKVMKNGPPRVLDSISCRNMYIRSYKFTTEKKKETVPEKTKRCFGKVKDKVVLYNKRSSSSKGGSVIAINGGKKLRRRRRKCTIVRKVKESLFSLFRKLLSCSTSVDVVDHHHLSNKIF